MSASHHCFSAIACLALAASSRAVDFQRDVKPILESRCYACHGADVQKAGIAFDHYHSAHQPTEHGRALWVAGKPEKSLLIEKVTASDTKERMPKGKAPLTESQIAILRTWIA